MDVVSCYIACGVPWDPRAQIAIRSRARGEALPTYVRAEVQRSVIDLILTAGPMRLTATPQPDS
ncbi:unnamed protein product, partial [Ixodes pacificus]